jgi:hypothetical protein
MRWPKTGQRWPMLTASCAVERARPLVAALVDRDERHSGSRMAAYERVAGTVGVSSRWVRRLLSRQLSEIAAHEYLNICRAYRSLCERIEAEAEHERRVAVALRRDADEALASALGSMGLASLEAGAGQGTEPVVVRAVVDEERQ